MVDKFQHVKDQKKNQKKNQNCLSNYHIIISTLVPFALLFIENAVLDDMATTWFLLLRSMLPHREGVALETWLQSGSSFSIGAARTVRQWDGMGTRMRI